jgi:hypothetical protein
MVDVNFSLLHMYCKHPRHSVSVLVMTQYTDNSLKHNMVVLLIHISSECEIHSKRHNTLCEISLALAVLPCNNYQQF